MFTITHFSEMTGIKICSFLLFFLKQHKKKACVQSHCVFRNLFWKVCVFSEDADVAELWAFACSHFLSSSFIQTDLHPCICLRHAAKTQPPSVNHFLSVAHGKRLHYQYGYCFMWAAAETSHLVPAFMNHIRKSMKNKHSHFKS